MKSIFKLLLLFLFISPINAQVTTLVDDVSGPSGLLVEGDRLYISEFNSGRVLVANLLAPNVPPLVLIDGLQRPYGLAVHDGFLYIADNQSGILHKINASNPTANPEEYLIGLSGLSGLAVHQDKLLIADAIGGSILSFDLIDPPLEAESIISGLNLPTGLAVNADDLFVSSFGGGSIHQFDLSDAIPEQVAVSLGYNSPNHLQIFENHLYVSEFDGSSIKRIPLDLIGEPETVLSNINQPTGIAFHDNRMIFSVFGDDLVAVYDGLVNIADLAIENSTSLYPNPTQEVVNITSTTSSQWLQLVTPNGKVLQTLEVSPNDQVNLSNYPTGLYYFVFQREGKQVSLPVIKQ